MSDTLIQLQQGLHVQSWAMERLGGLKQPIIMIILIGDN